jgi:succinyl-CoA synthetase alpha subunit
MGHAGAIITGTAAKADEKMRALRAAGAAIIPSPADIGRAAQELTAGRKKK